MTFKHIITPCLIMAAVVSGLTACISVKQVDQVAHPVVILPEETPKDGDILYVAFTNNDTLYMGYYEMQGYQREMFPNWREADKECGIDARGCDEWLSIAEQPVQQFP